jgi:serine/threonine protein kinase
LKGTISTDYGTGLVLPFAKSGDLFSALSDAALSEDDTKRIIYRVLSALQYLHGQNIWHRDVKPENILLMGDNHDPNSAVLADFGFARHCETTLSEDFVGSPHYCAPELYLRLPYNEKVDIWAVGLTMFACLTRSLPYNTASRRMMINEIVSGLPRLKDIAKEKSMSELAFDLCAGMLAKDSQDRMSALEALQHRWFDSVRGHQQRVGETNEIPKDHWRDSVSPRLCERVIPMKACTQNRTGREQMQIVAVN